MALSRSFQVCPTGVPPGRRWTLRPVSALALILIVAFSVLTAALPADAQVRAASSPTVAAAATPDPSPPPTPSRSATPAATAPTIESPPAGSFLGSPTITVSGTRAADQEIQLFTPNRSEPPCIVEPDGSTEWTCARVALPSGPAVTLRAVVTGAATLAVERTVVVLSPPIVTGGPTGKPESNGVVRGTGYPNAAVTAELGDGQRCTGTADAAGAWACTFADGLVNGPFDVTATQRTAFSAPASSGSNAPVSLRFDLDVPPPPTVASPTAGARVPLSSADYTGSGEDGATVTVFAGPYSVCTAAVLGGVWWCSKGGVGAGTYLVRAVQQDLAGNTSAGSPGISVNYGDAATAAPAPPVSPEASSPAETPAELPAEPAQPEETSSAPVPPAPPPGPSAGPPASQRDADASVAAPAGGWNDPTQFTSAVLPLAADLSWPHAALLALGALLLLAIPTRLLSGTISRARAGRPLWTPTPLVGRNHPRVDFETAPTLLLNRWLVAGAALIAAATLIMLSGPVVSRPAYLRLLLAVMVALVVVNAVGALVPVLWSRRVLGVRASVSFLPRYLFLVGVTALASRVFEVHPALLFGLLGSVTVAAGPLPGRRGQLAAVRAGSLILLAVVGWFALGAVPTATGFLGVLGAEIANSVVLAAIGSAVFVLVPIGSTSGRSILAWSPPIWAGLTALAFTLMFAVLSPTMERWNGGDTVTLAWVSAGVFAALSTGAWAWQRFVAPAVA